MTARSGEETPCVADIHSCEDMTQHGIEIRLGGHVRLRENGKQCE